MENAKKIATVVCITETFTKRVVILTDPDEDISETANDLCADDCIEFEPDNFTDRDVEIIGQPRPDDRYEVYSKEGGFEGHWQPKMG